MRKVFNRVLSWIITVSMFFSLGTVAFAADNEKNDELPCMENGVFVPEKMTEEERQNYNKLIDEQVNLLANKYGDVDREWIRNEIVCALEDQNYNVGDINKSQTCAGTIIPDINIANNVAAAAINVAIGMVVGGGITKVSAYVKKVGVQEAKKMFSKTIETKLKAWGLKNLSKILPVATTYVLSLLDPGTAIAKLIDRHDVKPNNGQINFIL